MGGFIGGTLLALLVFFVISALVGGFFLMIGAKLAGIRRATFWKSVWASLLSSIATSVATGLLSMMFGIGGFLGFLIGLFITLLIIRNIFDTSWSRAFVCWIFQVAAYALAIVLLIALGIGVVV